MLAHHSTGVDFLKGFKNRGCYKWYLQRTHLLPGPRFPCAKFDVSCNQLISSCKGPKREREKKHILLFNYKDQLLEILQRFETDLTHHLVHCNRTDGHELIVAASLLGKLKQLNR